MRVTPKSPPTGEAMSAGGSELPTRPQTIQPEQSFKSVFDRLASEVDSGERVVRTALRGNPYADDERGMIALQAGVYRYVEAVELCTKLVDRATGAVRTTLQNQ